MLNQLNKRSQLQQKTPGKSCKLSNVIIQLLQNRRPIDQCQSKLLGESREELQNEKQTLSSVCETSSMSGQFKTILHCP